MSAVETPRECRCRYVNSYSTEMDESRCAMHGAKLPGWLRVVLWIFAAWFIIVPLLAWVESGGQYPL